MYIDYTVKRCAGPVGDHVVATMQAVARAWNPQDCIDKMKVNR
jgi:hypothetical protein